MEELEVGELAGRFVSDGQGGRPGVVLLGGSDGGRLVHAARLLAGEGFACLALSYFGVPGLPRRLVEVPLDRVETALGWMAEHPRVAGRRIGVLGVSKGAEMALLAASTFPGAIGAVVAYAPSSVAFAGISPTGDGRHRSSWSYRGAPLPFVPYPARFRPALGWRGLSLLPVYRSALDDVAAVVSAAIPIERAEAPILLLSGDRDRMWPSSEMAEVLTARLAAAGRGDRVVHRRFAEAGHSFMPWAPDIRMRRLAKAIDSVRLAGFGGVFELGGRSSANRRALHEAWPVAVQFLREGLCR